MNQKKSFHQHYHFIRQLACSLNNQLSGAVFKEAFTLSKQELVLLFSINNQPFTVKVLAKFQSGFILFENSPYNKGSNAQSCFEHVNGLKVKSVDNHAYNRSFSIWFEDGQQLIFKCYDALINVMLIYENEVTDIFRESIQNDWTYNSSEFNVDNEAIRKALDAMMIKENSFYIYKNEALFYLSLTNCEDEQILYTDDPLEASSVYARYQLSVLAFRQAKISRIASIEGEIKRYRQQIKLSEQAIDQLLNESPFEELANIIMANLHTVKPRSTEVELYNFYADKNVRIKLKEDLSAADNAAYYYRKAKNKRIEIDQMDQKLRSMQQKLAAHEQLLENVKAVETPRQLKQYTSTRKAQEVFPFKKFIISGFEIWVGKNAANNDLLTQKYTHKNDLWLHAKDVSGSHTVIKYRSGKPFTKELINTAAQIAAYYSKHKGNALAPVTYTMKKFVRKPKGSEPGQVIIDREEVVMVEPRLP